MKRTRIGGKIWIQHDGTEYGVARELEDLGVSRKEIVLGFHSPVKRPLTDYAVGHSHQTQTTVTGSSSYGEAVARRPTPTQWSLLLWQHSDADVPRC